MFGSRVAVLVGDFLFAQSSWFLANLDNLEVRSAGNRARAVVGDAVCRGVDGLRFALGIVICTVQRGRAVAETDGAHVVV
jgi:hypothetical protein